MTGSVAARRYAKALFDLGRQSGSDSLDQWGGDLARLANLAGENADLARLFRDPVFSSEEKKNVVAALADRLSLGKTVRDFCFLLADKNRLKLLGGIAAEYRTLVDAEKSVLRGVLTSASPLSGEKQTAVLGQLEKKSGNHALVLDFKVDKSLLGGMVLKIGDNVMDASLKTQLLLLKDTIKRGE